MNINPNNISGIIPVEKGGLGINNISSGKFLFGGERNTIRQNDNLKWQNDTLISENNIEAKNTIYSNEIKTKNNITASYFYGDGSNINNINPENISGILKIDKGGTGLKVINKYNLLYGGDNNSINQNDNLKYENNSLISKNIIVKDDITATNYYGSGSNIKNLDPSNIEGVIPINKGGTGVKSIDTRYFDVSNNILSLKVDNIMSLMNSSLVSNPIINNPTFSRNVDINPNLSRIIDRPIITNPIITDINPDNFEGIVPINKGGTGVTSLDNRYFDISNSKLSLKLNSLSSWNVSGNNIHYNSGNIGIGISTPVTPLQVIGDISANNFIGSGNNISNINPNNINGIIPIEKGGTGVNSLDTNVFKVNNNKLTINKLSPTGNIVQCLEPLFDEPLFFWEGYDIINTNSPIFSYFSIAGTTTFNNTYYRSIWNNRYMIGVSNTDRTFNRPNNYARLTLPINPNTHNSIFLQTVTKDRWVTINMFICDPITRVPIVKIQARTNNHNGNTPGNSSFLGPQNQIAHMGNHEWLQFCIPKQYIDRHKNNSNEIIVSINAGSNNNPSDIWISGIASCANPYGLCTIGVNDMVTSSNGGTSIILNNGSSLDEALGVFNINVDYTDIRIPIASIDKGVFIVNIDYGNSNVGSIPRIYIPRYSNFKYWYLSPVFIGRFGLTIKGRNIYREPRGIFLSSDIVKQAATFDNNGALQLVIRINMFQTPQIMYTRGWYSEQSEAI
jgi:hypothetical protein